MHGAHEIRTLGATVRRKGDGDALDQFIGQGMVGESGPHHALLELVEIGVMHRHVKSTLGKLLPGALGQGPIYSGLCGGTHLTLVIEQAHDLVEWAVVYGLGHIKVPAWTQYPRDLAQSLIHQVQRYMVQRLQHQCKIKGRVREQDILRTSSHKTKVLTRVSEVLGVLTCIHF